MNLRNPRSSEWKRLFRIATSLLDQVNRDAPVIDYWTLGGGTAMMLQIGHRESHDLDIFIRDPQHLGYLNPAVQDFAFEITPTAYVGDGSRFMKFAFKDIGEIDFIVAPELTENPAKQRNIEGVCTLLETVPEVITKKVYFRGANITPRDIFDMAAAGSVCRKEVIGALTQYPEQVEATLSKMRELNSEFVDDVISRLMIQESFKELAGSAFEDARKLLTAVS